ncbi:hypothetical protein [Mucilaginibacter dorajii]|uniref:Uncharacterized protein n=1 Tax=Mucilaginibacter dorajii TaxID=692994 RepID=A0ABP7PRE6_9SPHI|nr:hypothetical protein [Mucilaginibacter dorajii]MCS3736939.1 hypothetical protein [Mucilaginibacter dorajii]
MAYIIKLTVSPEILLKYNHGGRYGQQQLVDAINLKEKLPVTFEYDFFKEGEVMTESKGAEVRQGFNNLLETHLADPDDDFLYYVLSQNHNARLRVMHMQDIRLDDEPRSLRRKTKDLAQLILYYDQHPIDYKTRITFEGTTGSTVRINSKELNNWLNKLIRNAIALADFPTDELVNYMPYLLPGTTNRELQLATASSLSLTNTAEEHHRIFTEFLWFIFDYLREENVIKHKKKVKYPTKVMLFLYDLAKLFEWLPQNHMVIDEADYIRSLFTNYFKKRSKSDK